MKQGLFLLLLILSVSGYSQNMVVNPSFEDTVNCPYQINQVNFTSGWDSWGGTPDFFHECANISAPVFGVPVNNRGFQLAHTGIAYMGLFTFNIVVQNGREYIGGTLTSPMLIGVEYFVSFWVSHADTSILSLTTDNLGIKFSTVAHNYFSSRDTVNNMPHVFSNSVISDTINWVLVQGSFIADSAYTHFGIANYFEDSLTTQSQIGTSSADYAYYLIDDVCVSAKNQDCMLVTDVLENNFDEKIVIFPNPGNGNFKVVFSGVDHESNSIITITNLTGQKLYESNMIHSASEVKFDAPDGIYILSVISKKGKYSGKLVIQH